jgi:Mrp family chromosome partitioning ATPase
MREWVEHAASRHDVVILDTPPVLSVADTRVLSSLVDGVVLVVSSAQASRRLVREARGALEAVGAPIMGIVVNKTELSGDSYYYNYYYYGERSGESTAQPAVRQG